MQGCIYIITNDVNNKVYIGLTAQSLQKRWYDHIRCSKFKNSKIYKAMREIGVDKFHIKMLETCDVTSLNRKEQEYIKKYNSYHDGYNSTLGGFGTHKYELDEGEIIELYKTYGLDFIANRYRCSTSVIKCILQKNNIKLREANNEAVRVVMLSTDYKILNIFDSKDDAYCWLSDNYRSMKKSEAYHYIKNACDNGTTAFGYKWMYYDDILGYDNEISYDAILDTVDLQNMNKQHREKGIKSKSNIGKSGKSNGRPPISCTLYISDTQKIEFKSTKDLAKYFDTIDGKQRDDIQLRRYATNIVKAVRNKNEYRGFQITIND